MTEVSSQPSTWLSLRIRCGCEYEKALKTAMQIAVVLFLPSFPHAQGDGQGGIVARKSVQVWTVC